jgi:hypothetical protein
MRQLLLAVLIALVSTTPALAQNPPIERVKGLGADRANLSPEEAETRSLTLQETTDFYMMRWPGAVDAPKRIVEGPMWEIIQIAAAAKNWDPFVAAGIIYIESYGNPEAKSPTGPKGITMFTRRLARHWNLLEEESRTKKISSYKWVGKGKKRRKIRTTKTVNYQIILSDGRSDPEQAIPAMIGHLSELRQIFGNRDDYAAVAYHMGSGRLMNLLLVHITKNPRGLEQKLTKDEVRQVVDYMKNDPLSYAELFFTATPSHNPLVYWHLMRLEDVDHSPTYYFRTKRAGVVLKKYLENPGAYSTKVALYQRRYGKEATPSQILSFWSEDEISRMVISDLEHLRLAQESGKIVSMPENLKELGISIETPKPAKSKSRKGKNTKSVAQAQSSISPLSQQARIATPATLGCLIYLANELRLIPGSTFKSLRATIIPPQITAFQPDNISVALLHRLGISYELPLANMKGQQRTQLEFMLKDMRYAGMLTYENRTTAFRVIPHPERTVLFEKTYRDATGKSPTEAPSQEVLKP